MSVSGPHSDPAHHARTPPAAAGRRNRLIAWRASHALAEQVPNASARRLFSAPRARRLRIAALLAVASFAAAPEIVLLVASAAALFYYLIVLAARVFLFAFAAETPVSDPAPPHRPEDDLPVVTLLLPVYGEAKSLASLMSAIDRLDYPSARLDAKLLIEENDPDTARAADAMTFLDHVETLIVPTGLPQTKPRACNFGLAFARGALTVIYDAEDAPEPAQLRLAVEAFRAGDPDLACVQARLNYYNAEETWLTRIFALEYGLWFDCLLPSLQKLGAPIPLGGTSNIFRTDILRKIGGWDAFNVTEDADIGLRLARCGYHTTLIGSTTWEEAPVTIGGWIRQRSRWIKGHLQTWIVHRRPAQRGQRKLGLKGVLSTDIFLGGAAFAALLNPWLLGVFVLEAAGILTLDRLGVPGALGVANAFTLLAGNGVMIALLTAATLKRGRGALAPYALLAPAYGLLASIAAYKALWQLVRRPSYWEKTDHGISHYARTTYPQTGRDLESRAQTRDMPLASSAEG